MLKPASRTRRAVSSSSAVPAAPAQAGSLVPKCGAEVAEPGGAQQGVAERVRGDVRVGVALEARGLVGPGQSGEVHRDPRDQPVDVGADADARERGCSARPDHA